MLFLYHLYVQIVYETFKWITEFIFAELMAETTVGILVQRQCLSAIPVFGQIYLGAKKINKKQPTACDWAVEAALACWQENGGSLLSSSQHVCTSIGETLRLPLTISSSFFRLPLSLLHPLLPWYVTELTVKVEFTYIIRSGPFLLCFLIKPARALLFYWWKLRL